MATAVPEAPGLRWRLFTFLAAAILIAGLYLVRFEALTSLSSLPTTAISGPGGTPCGRIWEVVSSRFSSDRSRYGLASLANVFPSIAPWGRSTSARPPSAFPALTT